MKNFSQHLFRSIMPSILIILTTSGVLLDVLIAERLEEEFDQLLVAKSQGIIALTEIENEGLTIEDYHHTLPQFTAEMDQEFFQFVGDKGQVFLSSLSMPENSIIASPETRATRRYLNVVLPNGKQGRLLRTRFLPKVDIEDESGVVSLLEADLVMLSRRNTDIDVSLTRLENDRTSYTREPLVLILAIDREKLDKLILRVHFLLLVTGVFVILSIAWRTRRRIDETVKPLHEISSQLRKLNPENNEQRVFIGTSISELDLLVQQVNSLLERTEHAFIREKRFSGDVAHELRTPLAEIRTVIEMRDRWPNDLEFAEHFSSDLGKSTARMQRTVESLLVLSRAEGGNTQLEEFTDLPEILREIVSATKEKANENKLHINLSIQPTTATLGGREEWFLIMTNLLENITAHSKPATRASIDLQVISSNNTIQLTLKNHVDDLQKSDLPMMFDRLWRKDKSRTSSLHSGLGLALVKSCAERIGATIESKLEDDVLTMLLTAPIVLEPKDVSG